jgi:hypothetical protein
MFTPFAFIKPPIDPSAQAFIDATGISGTDATAINTLVVDLKAASLWTKMKVIYPMVGGTKNTMKYNLVDPQDTDAAYRLTYVNSGSITFDSNGTFFPGIASPVSYARTHFNLSGSGLNSSSVHLSIYNTTLSTSSPTGSSAFGGVRDTSQDSLYLIMPLTTAGGFSINNIIANSPIQPGLTLITGSEFTQGLLIASRTTTTLDEMSRNGVIYNSYTGSQATNSDIEVILGARNIAAASPTISPSFQSRYNNAYTSMGEGLSSSEISTYYTIVQAYQTTLGRQV